MFAAALLQMCPRCSCAVVRSRSFHDASLAAFALEERLREPDQRAFIRPNSSLSTVAAIARTIIRWSAGCVFVCRCEQSCVPTSGLLSLSSLEFVLSLRSPPAATVAPRLPFCARFSAETHSRLSAHDCGCERGARYLIFLFSAAVGLTPFP